MKWKVLGVAFFVLFLTAFIGSLATGNPSDSSWYLDNKPSFTPPSYVFGPVWTVLYALIAVSLYLVWVKSKRKKEISTYYGVNLFLNAFWSFLFFGLQRPLLAFFEIILLWLSIAWLIKFNWGIDRRASWLLVPYLLWVLVATILNAGFL